ncbi:hypothetical protein TRIUR3_12007 [Triticum urartu]|uniref:F-box protein AT5G49610-like beta-propeller domain-containing protein n=1 Tax=Triticum urartu TaxID=4572 RepID=M7ZJK4_TRIUA|nr:hypothetical protein TRIUR3_12007 [Triticum urartu]
MSGTIYSPVDDKVFEKAARLSLGDLIVREKESDGVIFMAHRICPNQLSGQAKDCDGENRPLEMEFDKIEAWARIDRLFQFPNSMGPVGTLLCSPSIDDSTIRDAAYHYETLLGATDAIACDGKGNFIAAANWFLLHISCVNAMQITTIRNGLYLAGRIGCNKLMIEFDNSFAVEAIQLGGDHHCRNGRLITESFHNKATTRRHALLAPLLAGESATFPPPNPPHSRDWDGRAQVRFIEVFLPEDGGLDGITLVHLWNVGRKIYAEVCVLGSDGWGVPASAEMELPAHMELAAQRYDERFLADMLPPVLGKVFMVTTSGGFTLGLDLATASFFTLELPDGVQNNYKLSCAENSGLYLVGADGFQLSVWLHPMIGDDDGAGNWRLVDTFCVHETCTRHVGHYRVPLFNFIAVDFVGDNAGFAILDHPASDILFYVHLRSRVVEKVYQKPISLFTTLAAGRLHISPVMMTWPPIFPALNEGHDQEE